MHFERHIAEIRSMLDDGRQAAFVSALETSRS